MHFSNSKEHYFEIVFAQNTNIATGIKPNCLGKVKLGDKECFGKEQIGVKEIFMDYQPFYAINLLLDKVLGISEHKIVKVSKKRGPQKFFGAIL